MTAQPKTDRDRLLDIGFKVLDDFNDSICPHCERDDCYLSDPTTGGFVCENTLEHVPADDDYRAVAALLLDAWGVERLMRLLGEALRHLSWADEQVNGEHDICGTCEFVVAAREVLDVRRQP